MIHASQLVPGFNELTEDVTLSTAVDAQLSSLIDLVVRAAKNEGLYEGLRDTTQIPGARDTYERRRAEFAAKKATAIVKLKNFMS